MKSIVLLALFSALVTARLNLSNYTLTWNQDFTTGQTLSVSSRGPCDSAGVNGTKWMAHYNFYQDNAYFIDPSGDYTPFSTDNDILTIRAQYLPTSPMQLAAGCLNSMDDSGHGFAQTYGYFEIKAKLPKGPDTWPAFWTLDQTYVQTRAAGGSTYSLEIDIFENYGAASSIIRSTLHYWAVGGNGNGGIGVAKMDCGVFTGYHTYGFDYQPDYLTFYYDRQQYWRIPNTFGSLGWDTGYSAPSGKFDRPLYVIVDNAAPDPNASGYASEYLRGHPQDMLVEYVKVWQGAGGSDGIFTTADVDTITFAPSVDGHAYVINTTSPTPLNGGYQLAVTTTGNVQFLDSSNNVLWQTNTASSCATPGACLLQFVYGDLYLTNGATILWRTYTNGHGLGFVLSNTSPYLQLVDGYCGVYWDSTNGEQTPATYPPPPTGACAATTNTHCSETAFWYPSSASAKYGGPLIINNIMLQVTATGDIELWNYSNATLLWSAGTSADCSTPDKCLLIYQNDGNFVFYTPQGAIWGTNTWNQWDSVLTLSNEYPYLAVLDSYCNPLWSPFL